VTSRLSGFKNLTLDERRKQATEALGMRRDLLEVLSPAQGLTLDQADHMVENVVGILGIPVGIATNFVVNGRDVLVPMATEEPSVDPASARVRLLSGADELADLANAQDPALVALGGGVRDVAVRLVPSSRTTYVVLHLVVDVRDAMGANAVNTMAEAIAPRVAEIAGGRPLLRILTNKADLRLTRVTATSTRGSSVAPRWSTTCSTPQSSPSPIRTAPRRTTRGS
jgi:hydroxymethylglutaryl-CoA reductase